MDGGWGWRDLVVLLLVVLLLLLLLLLGNGHRRWAWDAREVCI